MEREEKGVLHKNNEVNKKKNKVRQYFMCEREKGLNNLQSKNM